MKLICLLGRAFTITVTILTRFNFNTIFLYLPQKVFFSVESYLISRYWKETYQFDAVWNLCIVTHSLSLKLQLNWFVLWDYNYTLKKVKLIFSFKLTLDINKTADVGNIRQKKHLRTTLKHLKKTKVRINITPSIEYQKRKKDAEGKVWPKSKSHSN
jgi:hypothetical protein